jgi:hypothetical protein
VGEIIQDLRSGVRMLARHRSSTAPITGLLALGIGACTVIFSLFDAVFLRSLPVHQPGDLVMLVQYFGKLGNRSELPYAYYESLRDNAKSLIAFGETEWPTELVMSQPAPAQEISLRAVTGNYFYALGVHALYGRTLLPSDSRQHSGMPPAVLSYSFWRQRFNGVPQAARGENMGMRLLEGRGFITSDVPKPSQKGPVMTVVNETFARRFFPKTDPVGKFFGSGTEGIAKPQFEVIGVVSNAKNRSLREPIPPMFYDTGASSDRFVLYVRTSMRPEAIMKPVQKIWRELGPGVPFLEVDTLAQEVRQTTANERLTAELTSLFGGLAALLAGIGIYGLLAYVVAQRRREIGIRMALGARPRHVAELIGGQTFIMMSVGVAAGLSGALIATPGVRSLLYGISPEDPKSLAAAIFLVAITAVLATLLPVLRAIRTPPAQTLREEN